MIKEQKDALYDYMRYLYGGNSLEDLVDLWNEVCKKTNNIKLLVYKNTDRNINEIFENPVEVAMATDAGQYRYDDEFIARNQNGKVVSFNEIDDEWISIDLEVLIESLVSLKTKIWGFTVNDEELMDTMGDTYLTVRDLNYREISDEFDEALRDFDKAHPDFDYFCDDWSIPFEWLDKKLFPDEQ